MQLITPDGKVRSGVRDRRSGIGFAGQGVELPGGYGQAWSNDLGEYIVADDPNFNPNLDSNLHWERMEKN